MSTITAKDGTEIYYKDWGKGQPIVFSHGWPLSADDWDTQMLFFLGKGFRVIAHDRRGHGRSTQTGGGEVVHYLARHGEKPSGKSGDYQCGATADGRDGDQSRWAAQEGF